MSLTDRDLAEILASARTIAVIGASRNPSKDAGRVPAFLKGKGYRIIPINPVADEILGERAYPSLDSLPEELAKTIDIVDVFRPLEEAMSVVAQVVGLARRTGRRPVLWFQPGTHTSEAVEEATREGLKVVYGRCIMMEYSRLEGLGLLKHQGSG